MPRSLTSRLGFPDVGVYGRFVTAIGIDAVGSGVWMPVSMIFFLATTDLFLVQVGLALSLASLLSLPVAVLVGQQVDRHGSKAVLQTGNATQALSFLAYPFVDQVWSVAGRRRGVGDRADGLLGLLLADGHADLAAWEREKWFGFLGALRNAGFAVEGRDPPVSPSPSTRRRSTTRSRC